MSALRSVFLCLFAIVAVLAAAHGDAATLHVGVAGCDITPDMPSFLAGQFSPRVSQGVECPLTATILALESRDGDKPLDLAIIISVDTAVVRASFLLPIRAAVQEQLPGFDLGKLIVAAKIGAAARQAWEGRRPARFSYGLGHAVVAYNRRAVYADGTAVMYGPTNDPKFRAIEGMEDHDVNSMFFWGHVLRIGDTVIFTNRFELYTEFGVQMKARSKAVQTLVVQLANGAAEPEPPADAPEDDTNGWIYASSGTYLPSDRAANGGGYGAVIQSNVVGPEGGQMLVEETVKRINAMW